jgi:hypothetical protein
MPVELEDIVQTVLFDFADVSDSSCMALFSTMKSSHKEDSCFAF